MSEVYVIDDDEAIRRSLTFLLRSSGHLVRTYESATEFLREASQLPPGCVITDVRMPDMDGLELVRRLRSQGLSLAAIVITGHADVLLAVEAMKAGAVDFIEKPFREDVLLKAVEAAQLADVVPSPPLENRGRYKEALSVLTPREQQILGHVVTGKTNKVIARDCEISPRTVEVHRANIMSKTGAGSLSDLVRMALLAG